MPNAQGRLYPHERFLIMRNRQAAIAKRKAILQRRAVIQQRIDERRQHAIERRLENIRGKIAWINVKNRFLQNRNKTIRELAHKEWFYKTDKPKPLTSSYSIGSFKELGKAKKNMYDDYAWARSLEQEALQYQYKKSVPQQLRYRVLKARAEWFRRRAQAQKNAIMEDFNYNKRYYNYKRPVY